MAGLPWRHKLDIQYTV